MCVCVCVCVCVCACMHMLSRVWLFATPWTVACQAPLSMEFSREEYKSGLLFPPPGDPPYSVIERRQVGSLPAEPLGTAYTIDLISIYLILN